jgi:GT2 family glycosyltransferase
VRVAVLTLTRDRLDYTKHCFARLNALAGCSFDHYVLDQGSQDGTAEWLRDYDPHTLVLSPENVGINRGLNMLLDLTDEHADYDAVVKFDNDCEVVTRDALKDCARFVVEHPDWLISPTIEGLVHPPGTLEIVEFPEGRVLRKGQIGGIFLAANADVYREFRYDERNPVWGMDDVQISGHVPNCGYLDAHVANHYETTRGQQARYGWYFDRRVGEGGPP